MSREGLIEALGETDEAIEEAQRAIENLSARSEINPVLVALVDAVQSLRDAVANIES